MDYKKAIQYWDNKDKENKVMDKDALSKWADQFLSTHNTLSLATGTDNYIDCTPLEYNYVNQTIYIFTEGGHKFIGLEKNKNVSVAVYDTYQGFGAIYSMQIYGTCDLVDTDSEEYYKLIDYKKIPRAAIPKINLYLLKINVHKINILCSDFKKNGFSNRQVIEF